MELDSGFDFIEGDSLPVFDEKDIIASSSEDKSQIQLDSAFKDSNLSYQARLDAFLGPLTQINSNPILANKQSPNIQRIQKSHQNLKIVPQVNLTQKMQEKPPLKQYQLQQQFSERTYYSNKSQDKENWSANMNKAKIENKEENAPLDIVNKIRFIKQLIDEVNLNIKTRLQVVGNPLKAEENVNQKLAISAQFLGERYQEMMKNFEEYKRKSSSHFSEQQFQSQQTITSIPYAASNNRQIFTNYYSNGAISDRVFQQQNEQTSFREKDPIQNIIRSKSFNGNHNWISEVPQSARQQGNGSSINQQGVIEEQRESPKNSGRNYLQLSSVLNSVSILQAEQQKRMGLFMKQMPIPKAQNILMQNWTTDSHSQLKKTLNGSSIVQQQQICDLQNSKSHFSVPGENRKKSQEKLIKQYQLQQNENSKVKEARSHSSYQEKYALLKQHFQTRQGIQL